MSLTGSAVTTLILMICGVGDDLPPPPPPLKPLPDPLPTVRKLRHYVVQVKLIEVDEHGHETVIGEPRIQTTGGNAGISVDHQNGRRFEFTMRLTDKLSSSDDLIPARNLTAKAEESLLKKLEQKLDLNAQLQPTREILTNITRRTGINIAIDPETARGMAAELELVTSLVVKDEVVSDVLDRLLQPLKLGYMVKQDAILIATPDKLQSAPDELIVKTYNVADLIKIGGGSVDETPDFRPLIDRIKSTIQPTSWDRKESGATIRPFNSTVSIVIRQTATAHSSIERLLDRLRRESTGQR